MLLGNSILSKLQRGLFVLERIREFAHQQHVLHIMDTQSCQEHFAFSSRLEDRTDYGNCLMKEIGFSVRGVLV